MVYLEENQPNILKTFGNLIDVNNYVECLTNIIYIAMRLMPSDQTKVIEYWSIAHLLLIVINKGNKKLALDYIQKLLEGVRSQSFVIYTTCLHVLNSLTIQEVGE
jgi:hypothetical protein